MKNIKFAIKRNCCEPQEAIDFLNSSAKNFYNGKTEFKFKHYKMFFKSIILNMLIDIERVIKGTFNCDIFMKNADYKTLNDMFPNGMKIFGVKSQADVIEVGRFFDVLRNASAHAYSDKNDFFVFEYDFSNLNSEKKYNLDIKYENKGKLTIAGLVFVIMNFLREESIRDITKKDTLLGLISCGKIRRDDGVNFVTDISHVNLAIDIRNDNGKDLVDSILGKFKNSFCNDGTFNISVGVEDAPTFAAAGSINKNKINIKEGSLTRIYYKDNYTLSIECLDEFISLSNQLPELTFIDLLYAMHITTYDLETHKMMLKRFDDYYKKLNHPKFYVDKNINTLLLPKNISDFRIVSSVTTDGVEDIIMQLELDIVDQYNVDLKGNYSRLSTLLKKTDAPDQLRADTIALRNFVMHGYVFGEHMFINNIIYKYSLEFVIKVLSDLLTFFENNKKISNHLKNKIDNEFIGKLLSLKYRNAIDKSLEYVRNYPNISKQLIKDIEVKNEFAFNSFYNDSIFNNINSQCFEKCYIDTYQIEGMNEKLHFFSLAQDAEHTNDFFSQYFELVETQDCGVIRCITVRERK